MSSLEEPVKTWEKRFQQSHYSYRDFQQATALVLPEAAVSGIVLQALQAGRPFPANVSYVFGINARANALMALLGSNYAFFLWPQYGDPIGLGGRFEGQCYARKIDVLCDQNAWVKIVSMNPDYLRQSINSVLTKQQVTGPRLNFEQEQYVPQNQPVHFLPTYGYAIIFRADTVQGTMQIWVEGNVEGTE